MNAAIVQFRENIARVRALGGLHAAFNSLLTSAVDASDVLRAQHVLAVSALDHYIHEVVRIGILEIIDGRRTPTSSFKKFRIMMDSVTTAIANADLRTQIESEVRQQHGYQTFQRPDSIADAVRLISPVVLWDGVATRLGSNAQAVKAQLTLIVDRRNKIAHEADLDPSYPGTRWPISAADVAPATDFIAQVCEAIHQEVA